MLEGANIIKIIIVKIVHVNNQIIEIGMIKEKIIKLEEKIAQIQADLK
jgi:hypothetical protein